ncbi:hypothetical protein FDI40_gp134 [Agrobacterium phage Atu_ph07]|uniref:Deoxynucleotide monophosphate kinase n=1 Tax=Agrobacterium phage Atu_ph07 TaxID=2024264 RepID=A0A223W099_9CAUD|nr:hypothetical protein FDI40_gp134 [Agrobacterium phage Atu_ph07]ASV44716.1 hypothetical protein [Agrobacterium phage Atu_ph07]
MKNIVGIVGFIGSGKNTAGDFFTHYHDYKQDSFASPVKDCVCAIFGWDREMIEGNTPSSRAWRNEPDIWWENELDWINSPYRFVSERFTPRAAMQLFGTDLVRKHFDDGLWIKSLERRIENYNSDVVITDGRFFNELNAIRKKNGKIIRIKKGEEPDWYETALLANTGDYNANKIMLSTGVHPSEWSWIGYDFDEVLTNDDTIDSLYSKLELLL